MERADPVFEESWQPYLHLMSHFVTIKITNASLVTSPAYGFGLGEEELRKVNLEKLNNLIPEDKIHTNQLTKHHTMYQ